MHIDNYSTIENPSKNKNQVDFVDRLVSFRSFLALLFFFVVQSLLLTSHIARNFSNIYVIDFDNFWIMHPSLLAIYLVHFSYAFLISFFYLAYILGRESHYRMKERLILLTFKSLLILTIFILANFSLIYDLSRLYYYKTYNIQFMLSTGSLYGHNYDWLIIILLLTLIFYLTYSLLSKLNNRLNRKSNRLSETYVRNVGDNQTPNLAVNEPTIVQQTQQVNQEIDHEKEVVVVKKTHETSKTVTIKENELNSSSTNEIKIFLDRYIFNRPFQQQLFYYFLFTHLFVSALTIFNLLTTTFSHLDVVISYDRLISSFEFFFIFITALIYLFVITQYYNVDDKNALKRSLLIVLIGFVLTFGQHTIGVSFLTKGNYIFYFLFKWLVLLVLVALPFVIQAVVNKDKSIKFYNNDLDRYNPVNRFFYNKSMANLRFNEKSSSIVKKFIVLHKENLKKSLYEATPLTFKNDVKRTFINDFERLEKLFVFNNISVKSKEALLDFTLEIFSTFMINIEMSLQEIYTENLLLNNPVPSEKLASNFINEKFNKLFTQWESIFPSMDN